MCVNASIFCSELGLFQINSDNKSLSFAVGMA